MDTLFLLMDFDEDIIFQCITEQQAALNTTISKMSCSSDLPIVVLNAMKLTRAKLNI